MILVEMHWIDALEDTGLRRGLDGRRERCTRRRCYRRHGERVGLW